MDVLERDDLDVARQTSPEDRANQALEAMRVGFRLKLAGLRARWPQAPADEIEHKFREWLESDDGA